MLNVNDEWSHLSQGVLVTIHYTLIISKVIFATIYGWHPFNNSPQMSLHSVIAFLFSSLHCSWRSLPSLCVIQMVYPHIWFSQEMMHTCNNVMLVIQKTPLCSCIKRTFCTSVDEQDVVLVDRTMNHVWVRLAGQQMLIEPLAAIFEGLREKTRLHPTLLSHFPELITTSLCFQLSDCGFFSLNRRLGKPSVLKNSPVIQRWGWGSICIIYAFVL